MTKNRTSFIAPLSTEGTLPEDAFKSAFEHASSGMVLADRDGRCLVANRSFCEMLGYSEQELLQLELAELTHPSDLSDELEYSRRLIAGEVPALCVERRYLHKNGQVIWTLRSAALVHDSYGYPLYIISQIQNITERKQTELALRRSQANQRAMLNALPDLVFQFDTDGTFRACHGPTDESLCCRLANS